MRRARSRPTSAASTHERRQLVAADQKIDGGPSVLYDAVASSPSARRRRRAGATTPAAKDFVTDALAHCKFIGYTAAAPRCSRRPGVADRLDDGFINLGAGDAAAFLDNCAGLRYWPRLGAGVRVAALAGPAPQIP